MTKDEFTRKLAKLNQIMNELIYALMQTGMSYRQAEEEVFGMLKRKRLSKETEDGSELTHTFSNPPVSQKCHEFVTCSLCIALV